MSEDNNLMQNIDKISYGVCGVVGVAVLVLAFTSGGGIAESNADGKKLIETVKENEGGNLPPGTDTVRQLAPELKEQWVVKNSNAQPRWLTERAPVLVRRSKKVEQAAAKHGVGYVSEISLERDAEKKRPFLRVKGVLSSENDGIEISRIVLYRKVDDKPAIPVPQFRATADFEITDYNIQPGSQYTYYFTSFAKGVDGRALVQDQQKTAELGPTLPIPHDFALNILFIRKAADGATPELRGKKVLYDYASGEIIQDKKAQTYTEGAVLDPAKRYTIRSIEGTGGSAIVTVRDNSARRNIRVKPRDKRTVTGWEPMVGEPAAAADAAAEGDEDEVVEEDDSGTADSGTADSGTAEDAGTTDAEPKKTGGASRGRTFK